MGAIGRVLLVLGVLLVLTIQQLPRFSSDLALWGPATGWNVGPRPAFNYGLALRKEKRYDEATLQFLHVLSRLEGAPRAASYRESIRAQFMAMEWDGYPVCDSDLVRPHC